MNTETPDDPPCSCPLCRDDLDPDFVAAIVAAGEEPGLTFTVDEFREWLSQL